MGKQMMDIGLTGQTDVIIQNGDFVVLESAQEHKAQLLLNGPGDFRQSISVGVGVEDYTDDDEVGDVLPGVISQQFAQDGMSVSKVALKNEILDINAFYI